MAAIGLHAFETENIASLLQGSGHALEAALDADAAPAALASKQALRSAWKIAYPDGRAASEAVCFKLYGPARAASSRSEAEGSESSAGPSVLCRSDLKANWPARQECLNHHAIDRLAELGQPIAASPTC